MKWWLTIQDTQTLLDSKGPPVPQPKSTDDSPSDGRILFICVLFKIQPLCGSKRLNMLLKLPHFPWSKKVAIDILPKFHIDGATGEIQIYKSSSVGTSGLCRLCHLDGYGDMLGKPCPLGMLSHYVLLTRPAIPQRLQSMITIDGHAQHHAKLYEYLGNAAEIRSRWLLGEMGIVFLQQ